MRVFLNTEGAEYAEGSGRRGDGRCAGGFGVVAMGNGSTELDYCQCIVLDIANSNVRRGSGMDGGSWREIGSLVRRIVGAFTGSEV